MWKSHSGKYRPTYAAYMKLVRWHWVPGVIRRWKIFQFVNKCDGDFATVTRAEENSFHSDCVNRWTSRLMAEIRPWARSRM